jgi:hypothetical protein
MGVQPWNLDGNLLTYNTESAELATKLISACGLDPKVTTKEEMDALQPRFALLGSTGVEITTWRRIVISLHPLKRLDAYYLSPCIRSAGCLRSMGVRI